MITTSAAAALLATGIAFADGEQHYTVSGDDAFTIGSQLASHVVYDGTERLHVDRRGRIVRFVADARYVRADETGRTPVRAHFVQELLPSGTLTDQLDDDPDSLTILNQPFAVELDPLTLRELAHLHGSVPFAASSPIAGGTLRGSLRRGVDGPVAGTPTVAVRFRARGAMRGALPDHADVAIDGTMQMDGTAYYAVKTALLVALTARLTITGTLHDQHVVTPVRIVYRRTIHAQRNVPAQPGQPPASP